MPRLVKKYQLDELSHEESKDEILIDCNLNTELHIITKNDKTVIKLPFGNKFDLIDGEIIIYEK